MATVKQPVDAEPVSEREAQLIEQLQRAQQELNDFVYIASHDLRAPLRGIESLAGWIATDYGDQLDEDGRELIELLSSRVRRVQNLLDGLLQYSRIGRIREAGTAVELASIVPGIIKKMDLRPDIEIIIESELPTIFGESRRLEQLFELLLDNAVASIDKAQGEIIISCTDTIDYWRFCVSDNGTGIEERHFEQIFQLFKTLQPPDETDKIGVGLTLARKIAEMYSGMIWVESSPGLGSTFHFTLSKQGMITE